MDASTPPYLIVRRPTLSWHTRALSCVCCSRSRKTHGGPAYIACVAEASSLGKRRVLAFLTCVRRAVTRSYVLVRRADSSSLKTLPFEDGTSRRLLRRRSLVTAGTSRRRSHPRLHIPDVHCCTPDCQGESIRRPIRPPRQ